MNSQRLRVMLVTSLAGVLATTLAQPALAQAGPSALDAGEVHDNVITVTATKREEDAQDVPIAITALDTEDLASTGVIGIEDLRAAVPALNVTTAVAGFGLPRIRGIGATGQGPGIENPVAVYVDGVYYGAAFGVLQSLFDAEQVAVLKGPQGTLFGRNATGGLVQVTTRGPNLSRSEVSAELGFGNYNSYNAAGFVSVPLADTLAISLSGQYDDRNKGFGTNLFTGNEVQTNQEWAGRAKLLFEPGPNTSLLLSVDTNGRDAVDPAFINFGLNTNGQDALALVRSRGGNPERDILSDFDPKVTARQWGASGTLEHDLGPALLRSITAYRRSKLRAYFDPDGTTVRQLVIDNNQLDRQFTQEVNLISNGDGPLEWVLGAFYMHDFAGQQPYSRTSGLSLAGTVGPAGRVDAVTRVELDSYSGFVEGTYAFSEATNVTAGIRYTSDKRSFEGESVLFNSTTSATVTTPYAARSLSFGRFSWRLSLDHRFSPEVLAYASYNRGFRAGAFGPQVINNVIPILKPELVDAFEVGLKTDLLDRRVRLNLSAYYNEQSSVQVMQVVSGVQNIYNAQGATIYGIDGDISVEVADNLRLFGGFIWSHGVYVTFTDAVLSLPFPVGPTFSTTNYSYIDSATGQTVANTVCLGTFVPPNVTTQAGRDAFYRGRTGGNCLIRGDASGNKLQNSPDFTFSLGGNWDFSTPIGRMTLGGNLYHNGGFVGTPDERVVQDAFTTVNASLTWHFDDTLYARFWGNNLTDAFFRSQIGASNSGDNGYSGPPRTYGVTLGLNF